MMYLTYLIEYQNGHYIVNNNVFSTLTESMQYIRDLFETEAYKLKRR